MLQLVFKALIIVCRYLIQLPLLLKFNYLTEINLLIQYLEVCFNVIMTLPYI